MKTSTGIKLISEERERQQRVEGYWLEDDRRYTSGELCDAAMSYAKAAAKQARGESLEYLTEMEGACEIPWPWDASHWKPSESQIRNLVKAGALIAAEIDRLSYLEENA